MRQLVSTLAGRITRAPRSTRTAHNTRGTALAAATRAATRTPRGSALRTLRALAVVAGAMLWGQAALAQGTVTISGPAGPLDEGAAAMFTATLSEVNTSDVTVPYTLSGITAADVHGDLTGNSIVITRGSLSQRFTIYILVDGAGAETGESLIVTLNAPTIPDSSGSPTTTGAPTLHATNSVTVAINDSSEATAPAVATTLAALADSAVNAAPGTTAAFRITISGFRAAQAQVEWEVLLEGANPATAEMFADRRVASASATGLPSGINGVMTVPAGHAQVADIRVRLHPLNRLSSGGTFNYKVRIRRTIQYTDAGERPDPLPAVCTSSCTEADGSILIPASSATLTVDRSPEVDDPFVANPGTGGVSPDAGIGNQGSGGANSYTLREELTRAQERYLRLGGARGIHGASSLLPGQAAIFRVDLCDDSFSGGCRALAATQNVTFGFEIGGSNSGYGTDGALAGKDYRTPSVDGGTSTFATAVNGGASWTVSIPPGSSRVFILVPLIDDDVAEPDETLNLRLMGTPTVAAADGGTVSLAASPNDRSRDYTIIGAEPPAVTSPAGSVALTGAHLGAARNGDRVRFTFTLTDDDTATGDDQTGADDTYRLWYALYASDTGNNDGFRFWTVLANSAPANANDPAFFDLVGDPTAINRFRICDSGGNCETSAGDYLTRRISGYGDTPKGYGWVILPQGQTIATLDVVTNAHASSNMAMSFFAVDNNTVAPGNTALPTYDYNTIARVDVNGVGNAANSRAFFRANGGSMCTNAARAEGDTVQCRVNFRGITPSTTDLPLDADNPLTVTWRLMGSVRHGDVASHPASAADINVTQVAVRTNVSHATGAGSQGIGNITSDADRHILAQQNLSVTGWSSDGTEAFTVHFTVVDDALAEPAESYYLQVITDRPGAVGEIPGDGTQISASDAANVTVEAIRGTDTDGDESDGSWQEAAPSGNDNQLRFRIAISGGRPQENALIGWAIIQDADGSNGDVSRGDFLQCVNTPVRATDDLPYDETMGACSRTRPYTTLPSGAARVSADLAAQETGPWYINLPFLLNDDGVGESAEDFTIDVGVAARTSGINTGTVTDVDFTIAESSSESRLIVGIGDAICANDGSTCRGSGSLDTSGAVPAVNDRNIIPAPRRYQGEAKSDYSILFPLAFYTPDGDDAGDDPDPLAAGHNVVFTGPVTISYRIGGTIFESGVATGGDIGGGTAADLSIYPRGGLQRFYSYTVRNTYRGGRAVIRVPLPLASITSPTEPATFTITLTSASMRPRRSGEAGVVEIGADNQGQVQVRRSGGLFFITAAGSAAGVAANRVAESAGPLTYNVQFYSAGQTIPTGGLSVGWVLSHGVAERDTICNECPEGTGDTSNADFTGVMSGRIQFQSGRPSGESHTITININDDNLSEDAESFSLTINNLQRLDGTAYTGREFTFGRSVYTTTIDPNDTYIFTLDCPATVQEDAGTLSCSVTHSGTALPERTTIGWNVGAPNPTYTATPADFKSASQLSRPNGNTFPVSNRDGAPLFFDAGTGATQTFTFPIIDDADAEEDESFAVVLHDPQAGSPAEDLTNVRLVGNEADVTIPANDAALTVTCAAAAGLGELTEGMATTVANCQQTTGSPLAGDVEVAWALYANHGITAATAATATAATDFTANSGTLIIPQGTASGVDVALQITASDDGQAEAAEEFSLVITEAGGARYVDATIGHDQDLTVAASQAADVLQFEVAVADSVSDVNNAPAATGTQVDENVGTVQFTVRLAPSRGTPPAPTSDVTVDWAASGVSTADDLTGYPATGRTLTFTPSNYSTAQTVTLTVADDGVNEATEDLILTLSNAGGGGGTPPPIGTASATIQIQDNDTLTFTVARKTPASGAVAEGGSQVFSVTPSGGTIASGTTVTVAWAVQADSDTNTTDAAAGDFRATGDASDTTALASFPSSGSTPLSFTGLAAQDVTVWTLDDSALEGEETFQLALGTISGADGATAAADSPLSAQIAVSDAPVFSISATTSGHYPSANREGGIHVFEVVGSGATPAGAITVRATVSSDEAEIGDFRESGRTIPATQFTMGDLSFNASNYTTAQEFEVFSINDSAVEGTENFTVTLTVVSGSAALGTATAQGAILFSDFEAGFASTTYSVAEGEILGNDNVLASGETVEVCVAVTTPDSTTNFPAGVEFSLAASTTAGTAVASDYVAITNQVLGPFNDSTRQACFDVATAHDVLNEGAETFVLDLSPPSGVTLSTQSVNITPSRTTLTIPANDPLLVGVTADQMQTAEGGTASFTLAFVGRTIASPDTTKTQTITYAPTAATTVTWTLSGTGITAGDFTGITSLTTGNSTTLAHPTPDYGIDIVVAEEAAQDPDDVPETFTLTVTGGSAPGGVQAASSGAAANVEIVAAGAFDPTLTLSGDATRTEPATSGNLSFTVTLSNANLNGDSSGTVQVTGTVTHITTNADDFTSTTATASFDDDGLINDAATLHIPIAADDLNEGTESFSLQISVTSLGTATGNINIGNAPLIITLNDHAADATAVTIARDSGTQSSVSESATADFTVTLSGGIRTGALTVPVSFTGLSDGEFDITAPTGDYDNDPTTTDTAPDATATGLTLVFPGPSSTVTPAATDSITVSVNLLGDTLNEASETLVLTGAAAGNDGLRIAVGSVSYATNGDTDSVGITDDDPISVSIAVDATNTPDDDGMAAGHQRQEGTAAAFIVTLSTTSAADATIPYTISGVETEDYTDRTATTDASTQTNGQLIIPSGNRTGTITLNLEQDADADTSESLTVTLTAPVTGPPAVVGPTLGTGGGTIALSTTTGEDRATVNIIPLADARTLTVTGAATHTETDGDTIVTYTVNLAGTAFTNPTEVSWAVTLGTGTEAADFSSADPPVAPSGSITFPTQTQFTVTIIGDNVNEANEVFSVQISVADADADGGTAIGAAASTTIEDDDDMTYSIAADSATVDEEAASAAASYTLTLSGADSSEGDVEIRITVTGTATSGTDYTAAPTSVTVGAGDTSADLDLSITADNFAEAAETIIVTLGETPTVGAGGGAFARTDTAAQQSATVSIDASDPLTLTLDRIAGESGSIRENGGAASFIIQFTGTTEVDVEVPFNVGGTGITADDYNITSPTSDPGDTSGQRQVIAGTDRISASIVVTATDDSAFEGPETLTVTINLAGISPASIGAVSVTSGGSGSASVVIDDDEGVTVTIAAADNASITEGNNFSITATPTAHDRDITLNVALGSTAATDDNDAEAADYGAPTGTTLSTSGVAGAITIAAVADGLNEGDETFTVTITGATTAVAGGASIPVTIAGMGEQTLTVRDPTGDAITLNIALAEGPPAQAASVDEDGEARFTVSMSGGRRTQDLIVPFEVSSPGGTRVLDVAEFDISTPNLGAEATGGILTFTAATAATVTSQDIVVDLVGDSLNEATEELIIVLAAPGTSGLRHDGGRAGAISYSMPESDGSRLSPAVSATDDDTLTYSITAPMALDEGDTGTQTLSFTVSLSGGVSAGDITIPYSLGGSDAAGGPASNDGRDFTWPSDYDPTADGNQGRGSVRIDAGGTSVTLDLEIIGDAVAENDEDIVVTLLSPATPGAGAGVANRAADEANYRATGTITDDDATHIFSLSCPDPADTAMTATLTEAASGDGPMCTATYTSGSSLALNAAALLTWTVQHSGGSVNTSAADFAGGAAALRGDITIPAGSRGDGSSGNSVSFALPRALADSVSEAAETFTVALSLRAGETALPTAGSESAQTQISGGTAMPVIAASDPLTVSIGDVSGTEQDANADVEFPVSFSPGGVSFEGNLELAYRTIEGAGVSSGDYSLAASPLSIDGAEVQSGSFGQPVTVRADNLNEGAEMLTVRLTSATLASANISLGGADENAPERNGALNIAANDPTAVSIAAAAGMAAEGTAAEFTVTLSGGETTADATVAYSFAIATQANTGEANGAGNPDATDPGSGSITIDAGETSGTITINISPDGLAEGDEMLVVSLGALSGGGGGGISGTGDAQVTIPSNAAALHVVGVSGPDAGVMEGGSAVFTFNLPPVPGANARNAELTAEYSISGVAPGDYSDPGNGQVTFPIGTDMQTVTIAITDDDFNEGAETLMVALTDIVGATDPLISVGGSAASGSATVEIAASDPLRVTLLRIDSGDITEGGSANFQFTVLDARLSADATIPYTISGTGITAADVTGNAASGLAADSLAGSVTVAASSSTSTTTDSATIRFTAADDALNEATETFAIAIGTPSVAAGGGAISAVQPDNAANRQVAITDNDDLTLAVSGPASVGEGSTADYTVTLTGAADGSAGTLEVAYSVMVGNSQNTAAGVAANSDSAPDIQLLDASGNVVDAAGTGADGRASGTLTIAAGAVTATIQLRANFDNLNEAGTDADNPLPDETVTLTLTGVTPQADVAGAAMPAAAPGNAHTTNIENVNAARTLSVSVPQASQMVSETAGASIEFMIALTGAAPVNDFVADWSLESDGAQLPAASGSGLARNHGGPHPDDPDVGGPSSGTVTFAAGSMAPQMVRVPVVQDSLNEGDEALRLRIRVRDPADGGVPAGFPAGAPATQVSVETGRTVIPQNDPIVLALVRPPGQTGAQTSDDFGFAVSFGCADGTSVAAGNCQPVVPSTDVSIPYTYNVGGTDYTGTLMVSAGDTAADVNEVAPGGTPITPPPAAMTALMNPSMVQTVTVSFGTPQVTPPANAPSGATPPMVREISMTERMAIEAAAEVARREGRPAPPETVAEVTVQVGAFSAALNTQRIEAPEGTSAVFTVTIGVASGALTGDLTVPWSTTLAAPSFAPPRDDGSPAAAATAADFPAGAALSGNLIFTASALTQRIEIPIATDDLDEVGGEYFQVTLGTPSGTDAGNVAVDASPSVVLIPSLRATLSVADVTVAEGADAVFELNLADFVGGSATTQPLTVHYILEDVEATRGDRAEQGADFVAPLRGSAIIPAGQTRAEIRIPVLQDGVLEPTETFRLRFTVTADGDPPADGGRISGGGGLIVFTAAEGTATATIRDDADQARRRTQRVAAMVAALDRQTAELATDAITDRFERAPGGSTQTALSIAGRSLIGGASAAAGAGSEHDLGLALFGAAGLGGAGLGVSGAGTGASGVGAGGAGVGGDAFGGLGAGLSGGANVWRGQDLPSLSEALSGTRFSFSAAGWTDITNLAEGLEVWGRGGTSDLKGNLSGSNGTLRYKGDSIAVFVGADRPVRDDMLAGLALGYSVGDLSFTDTAGTPSGRFELSGTVDTNMLSLHPYFSWWITPDVNTWLALGYGTGSVDLQEEDAGRTRTLPGTADSSMWMLAAGVSGRVRVTPATHLKLSFELSRVGSEVDAATFDDGAQLNNVRARSLRVGGEAEVSRNFALPGGFALRPFATGRLRFESGGQTAVHGVGDRDAAFDLGGGVSAAQPAWGLDAQLEFSDQLNSSGQEEQRLSLDLSYDLDGDKQGLTMSVKTAFSERRSGSAARQSGNGNGLWGFGSAANNLGLGSGSFGALSGSTSTAEQSIAGEIGYGVSFRQLGRAGLLTPYGRFDLRQSDSRWAAGLRLAETGGGLRLGLEGGLDLHSGLGAAAARDFDLMLTGQLRF